MKPHPVIIAVLPALFAGAVALADDPVAAPAVRKQFRQSSVYPYIFQPECYLATTGPVPLRFAPPAAPCSRRAAPPLLEAAKGVEKALPAPPTPAPATGATETSVSSHASAAYQPPADAPKAEGDTSTDTVDFKRMPEEVLEFFRNNDGKAGKRIYLFDPIFQPALPHALPKSKATYTQKP